MSDLVGNPEDRFSCDAAHIEAGMRLIPMSGKFLSLRFGHEIISIAMFSPSTVSRRTFVS